MKLLKFITLGVFTASLLISCQKEPIDDLETSDAFSETFPKGNNASIASEDLLKLKDLDFDTEQEIIKTEDGYVVEGDMLIPFEHLEPETLGPEEEGIEKQHRHIQIVRCSRARNIRVKNNLRGVDQPVRNAIADWNRVNGSFLKFTLVKSGRADITISFKRNDSGVATHPRNGRPGPTIKIDPGKWRNFIKRIRSNAPFGRAFRYVIRHELGHCIGFRHSNRSSERGRVRIPGVPSQDVSSIMNQAFSQSHVLNLSTMNLSNNDKKALRKLYGGSARSNICF
ncbi:M57 family metalloprotease [Aquimarina agarivorans]|uniref:M57 family metalloprotease n=1 Tax=Aquimarina agarivorans TaxID=980584 RepID=UPI000248F319|nr:M57 family metalloprotease [Aquimarina agarivorans]